MKSLGRNYVDPNLPSEGLAGEVIRVGYAITNVFTNSQNPQGEVEVRFLGNFYKSETQRVQLKQVKAPFTTFTWKARWSNEGIAKTIRIAQGSVEVLRVSRAAVRNSQ